MNLMSLAAEPNSGKNVNDKVKITNPTLSLNKSNNHANNVIWPTSNEQFNLKANYELDDSIKEEILLLLSMVSILDRVV